MSSRQERVVKIDLVGYADTQPVYLRGAARGEKPNHTVTLDIWGDNIPLDPKLMAALPAKYQALARSFHPTGLGNFQAFIRHTPETKKYSNRYVVQFHHATVRYDVFPYPLEDVTGTLDIGPDHWDFRDFRGTHKGGEFRTAGHSQPDPEGDRVAIAMRGTNILLDGEVEKALKPDLRKTWKTFAPAGRMDFEGKVTCQCGPPGGTEPDIELTVYPRDCSIRPEFFQWPLEGLCGKIHYARNWVTLENLRAHHGDSVVALEEGFVFFKPEGGAWVKLIELRGNPVQPNEEFLQALPSGLQKACRALQLKDPVTFKTTYLVIDVPPEAGQMPKLYWDGCLELHDATLQAGIPIEHITGQIGCRGVHNGQQLELVVGNLHLKEAHILNQPLQEIHSQIVVTKDAPEVLRLPGLHAHYFGGEIYGPLRIEFGPTVRYELKLDAAQVKLEEFSRYNFGNDPQMQGEAEASIYLMGEGGGIQGLRGNGNVDVPNGKMCKLPLFLPLIKVLGLRPPDRTFFEEAHARFSIQGLRGAHHASRHDRQRHQPPRPGRGEFGRQRSASRF